MMSFPSKMSIFTISETETMGTNILPVKPPNTIRTSHPVQDSTKVSLESDPADVSRIRRWRLLLVDAELPLRDSTGAVKWQTCVDSQNLLRNQSAVPSTVHDILVTSAIADRNLNLIM